MCPEFTLENCSICSCAAQACAPKCSRIAMGTPFIGSASRWMVSSWQTRDAKGRRFREPPLVGRQRVDHSAIDFQHRFVVAVSRMLDETGLRGLAAAYTDRPLRRGGMTAIRPQHQGSKNGVFDRDRKTLRRLRVCEAAAAARRQTRGSTISSNSRNFGSISSRDVRNARDRRGDNKTARLYR